MTKIYTQAPLPFQGQKRRWSSPIKTALKDFAACTVFVDLFGGSGLLSRMVKDARPDAFVIYNDFDSYQTRLRNVDKTNKLLSDIRLLTNDVDKGTIINGATKAEILKRVEIAENEGYVDYITLSSSLLFGTRYVTSLSALKKEPTLYNNVRMSDYIVDGYLDGLEVVNKDYKDLFERWQYRPDVCFIVDPPYLSTDTGTYTGHWMLKDYLDVLHTLKDTNYFYFTSNKSNIVDLCEWMSRNYAVCNPFDGATVLNISSPMNFRAKYIDIMLYKMRD